MYLSAPPNSNPKTRFQYNEKTGVTNVSTTVHYGDDLSTFAMICTVVCMRKSTSRIDRWNLVTETVNPEIHLG